MFHCNPRRDRGDTSSRPRRRTRARRARPPVAFSNNNPTVRHRYGGFEPRVWRDVRRQRQLNVLRVGYGRAVLAAVELGIPVRTTAPRADVPSYDAPKFSSRSASRRRFHENPAARSRRTSTSRGSIKVQGSDVSWKVTPVPAQDAQREHQRACSTRSTNFVSGDRRAREHIVRGVELLLRKGDFNRNGFAGPALRTRTRTRSSQFRNSARRHDGAR